MITRQAYPSMTSQLQTKTPANREFTVTLSAASGLAVTVNYATSNGTATAGADYTAISATTLTFSPGQTTKTFNVAVLADSLDEANETVTLTISSASNATISRCNRNPNNYR